MRKSYMHIVVAGVLVFLLMVLADFVPFWMPMMGQLIVLLIVVVLLLVWAGFVLQEQSHDEREVLLKMRSGRVAYLAGLGVLLIGLIVQTLSDAVDPWLAAALAVMVIAKLITRLYLE